MPVCPKCKNEYVEGVTECADCGCALVDSIEEQESCPLIFGEQPQMERLAEFLAYNGLQTVQLKEAKEENLFELYTAVSEAERARKAMVVFLHEEAKNDAAKHNHALEADETKGEAIEERKFVGVYQNSEEKSKDFRSSAIVLIGVGGVGLLACILFLLDVFPLYFSAPSKYMTIGVMGSLFLLFLVMGFLSLQSSKKLEKEAESENMLTAELKKWCFENLTKEAVDAALLSENGTEEELYFKRTSYIQDKITGKFVNLEENYLDNFIEEIYPQIFEP